MTKAKPFGCVITIIVCSGKLRKSTHNQYTYIAVFLRACADRHDLYYGVLFQKQQQFHLATAWSADKQQSIIAFVQLSLRKVTMMKREAREQKLTKTRVHAHCEIVAKCSEKCFEVSYMVAMRRHLFDTLDHAYVALKPP